MLLGQVASVHRYPVKSLAGESLDSVEVGLDGLLGDRAYALRDDVLGELRSARSWPALMLGSARYPAAPRDGALIMLPDGREVRTDDPAVSRVLSAWLGKPVTLHPRLPASNRQHYRRARAGASVAGLLARSPNLRKVVARIATVGAEGADLRDGFAREAGEPRPDLSVFPAELFEYVTPPGTYFDAFPIRVELLGSL